MTWRGPLGLGVAALVTIALVLSLLAPAVGYADPPDGVVKPDKTRPVPATDVELVKKVSRPGPATAGLGAEARAPKTTRPSTQAATGILGAQVSGSKYAILVGISNYPGTANDLVYGDDDAEAMKSALRTVYGYSEANIHVLLNLAATRSAILSAIDSLASKVGPNDEVVFFFSGHGGKGRAADGDKEAVDEAIWAHDGSVLVPIWDGELVGAFGDFATSRIVFAFDSCLAGGMTDLKLPGRVIAMASTETGYSYEGAEWGNGEFTYYFAVLGMLEGAADNADPDSAVTVEEAWDYAKANCRADNPTIGDSFLNDLLL